MNYAPVLIPTLCRYEHFKNCLESLEKCTGAEYTDVFVALDFPLNQNHKEGYNKIVCYLETKVDNNHFKTLNIIKRERNYGIGVGGNIWSMRKKLFLKYENLIFSEDDNIFSPNFLQYINKGLEKFKDDENVLAINGYSHPYSFKFSNNNYFFHNTDFSAWGYGIWRNKYNKLCQEIANGYLKRNLSLRNLLNIRKTGLNRLLEYLLNIPKSPDTMRLTDAVISNYLVLSKNVIVMPKYSKVRNIGWDNTSNSQINFKKKKNIKLANIHINQPIDTSIDFSFIGNGWEYYVKNNNIAREESDGRINFFQFLILLINRPIKKLIKAVKDK